MLFQVEKYQLVSASISVKCSVKTGVWWNWVHSSAVRSIDGATLKVRQRRNTELPCALVCKWKSVVWVVKVYISCISVRFAFLFQLSLNKRSRVWDALNHLILIWQVALTLCYMLFLFLMSFKHNPPSTIDHCREKKNIWKCCDSPNTI